MDNSHARCRNALLLNRQFTEGFSTLEVLVGILITIAFLAVAAQSIAVAAALRVRAQESSDAAGWVKDDRNVIEAQALQLGGYDADTGKYADIPDEQCAADSVSTGFAALLREQGDNHPDIASSDTEIGVLDTDPKVSPIGNRNYTLQRATSIEADTPHVLRVDYQVFRGSDTSGDPIFQYRTEVIPGVAFACRQI